MEANKLMYITVKVPDNATRLFYAECGGCYETEQKPITMGMIVKVEKELDIEEIIAPTAQGDNMPEEKP